MIREPGRAFYRLQVQVRILPGCAGDSRDTTGLSVPVRPSRNIFSPYFANSDRGTILNFCGIGLILWRSQINDLFR